MAGDMECIGMKIKIIRFDDEIALYWEKPKNLAQNVLYRIRVNDRIIEIIAKTHFEIDNLTPNSKYRFQIEQLDGENKSKLIFDDIIRTKKEKKRIDVTKAPYFAKGDGKTSNTKILQSALKNCKKDECIYFPQGEFLTGGLDVYSNTEIYLSAGAVLKGTEDINEYLPKMKTSFEGSQQICYRSLLNIGKFTPRRIYNIKNVVIRGGGKIFGGGVALCRNALLSYKEDMSEECVRDIQEMKISDLLKKYTKLVEMGRVRSKLISVHNARNIIFSNITFGYGSSWTVHMIYSKNILTYNCGFLSKGVWNGDGWDPESSKNCTIFGCSFETHDDAIAIKSGKNLDGSKLARPTKNVKIFDCNGKMGIAIGSELSGGIKNISVWDCKFTGGRAGFRIKTTKKRGGYVKNVKVRNCQFSDVKIWTGYPINDDGNAAKKLTYIHNVLFENVESQGYVVPARLGAMPEATECILIEGFEEDKRRLKDIKFSNIILHTPKDKSIKPIKIKNATNVILENINYKN